MHESLVTVKGLREEALLGRGEGIFTGLLKQGLCLRATGTHEGVPLDRVVALNRVEPRHLRRGGGGSNVKQTLSTLWSVHKQRLLQSWWSSWEIWAKSKF